MRAARRPEGAVGLDAVDLLAERAMRSGRRIGLVVGCLHGGEQRVVGYGRLRRDAQGPPDRGTIFEIGSVTKVFTGLLLADLAEDGVVGLDDPLASYLPGWVRVPTFKGHQVTLGELASHAGGLRRDPEGTLGRWLGDRRNPYASLSVEGLYAGLARTRLRRRPGERVKYSNLGAGLLGEALARAAGRSFEELVRERTCLPLGMRDTVVTPTGEQAARLATGHARRGRPVAPFQLPALGRRRGAALDRDRPAALAPGQPRPCPGTAGLPAGAHAASPAPGSQADGGRARLADRAPAWGCWSGAVAQRRDRRLSQLRGLCQGGQHGRGRAQQHRPIGRPAGAAAAQGVVQRRRRRRWLIRVGTGSRRRRGLARRSALAAGRNTGPG
jgi:CubicO group peptidase (beta-lactamase class C family)